MGCCVLATHGRFLAVRVNVVFGNSCSLSFCFCLICRKIMHDKRNFLTLSIQLFFLFSMVRNEQGRCTLNLQKINEKAFRMGSSFEVELFYTNKLRLITQLSCSLCWFLSYCSKTRTNNLLVHIGKEKRIIFLTAMHELPPYQNKTKR